MCNQRRWETNEAELSFYLRWLASNNHPSLFQSRSEGFWFVGHSDPSFYPFSPPLPPRFIRTLLYYIINLPSPEKPRLHLQPCEPTTFMHAVLAWQSCAPLAHSSISVQHCTISFGSFRASAQKRTYGVCATPIHAAIVNTQLALVNVNARCTISRESRFASTVKRAHGICACCICVAVMRINGTLRRYLHMHVRFQWNL